MGTCLASACISSLLVVFWREVVEIVLDEVRVLCICLCLEEARSSYVEVISVSPCFCLCIRLDIGRLLVDCETDDAMYLLEEEVSDLCGQEHRNRRHLCWQERGRERVLEEGHLDDRWSDHQGGRYRLRIGRNHGR
jgi:hypothetical protein